MSKTTDTVASENILAPELIDSDTSLTFTQQMAERTKDADPTRTTLEESLTFREGGNKLWKTHEGLNLDKYDLVKKRHGYIPALSISALNESRARYQGTGSQMVNGIGKAGITFLGAVVENTIGVPFGLYSGF